MRELEVDLPAPPDSSSATLPALAIVGRGRVGRAIAGAADRAGLSSKLAGRDDAIEACRASEAALLCVPDQAITEAAAGLVAAIPPLKLVGHASGASELDALAPALEAGASAFSLHPLQTVPDADAELVGAACAIAGSDARALDFARRLAVRLGMLPFELADEHRATYHAAASIASNFLVALQESAAALLAATGVREPRELLVPLVLRTAANWGERGAEALTGPIARGDEATVARHLEALREEAPELIAIYEALADRTRELASHRAQPAPRRDSAVRILRGKDALRAALDPARRRGARIGLVPTMGALHGGHFSLLRAARETCDVVVMSLFVNPAQFRPGEDLTAYPRDERRDAELAEGSGVDLIYAPAVREMYPDGFATAVEVGGGLTTVLDGDPARRGAEHFRGVTTVVAKLFNAVDPDVAFFGGKDAQQAVVIRRMTRDLDFRVEIVVVPTVREPDGLAMSSRNAYLGEEDRRRAGALSRALAKVEGAVGAGTTSVAAALAAGRAELVAAGIEPEYLEARDAGDLTPVESFNERPVLVAVAARLGDARLIDNVVILGKRGGTGG